MTFEGCKCAACKCVAVGMVCWGLGAEQDGRLVFEHACLLGCEGIVSKRKDSRYRSGRSRHWVKIKNPAAPAVKREAEEDWGR